MPHFENVSHRQKLVFGATTCQSRPHFGCTTSRGKLGLSTRTTTPVCGERPGLPPKTVWSEAQVLDATTNAQQLSRAQHSWTQSTSVIFVHRDRLTTGDPAPAVSGVHGTICRACIGTDFAGISRGPRTGDNQCVLLTPDVTSTKPLTQPELLRSTVRSGPTGPRDQIAFPTTHLTAL